MRGPFRMTVQTQLVLRAMLDEPDAPHYGFELSKTTGLKAGTMYPMLSRLEEAGWIEGFWEQIDSEGLGRPPRRYYKLTIDGRDKADRALAEHLNRLQAVADRAPH